MCVCALQMLHRAGTGTGRAQTTLASRVASKGSFTIDFNQNNTCNLCTVGTTTLGEGYTSITDCAYANTTDFMWGHTRPASHSRSPLNTYNAVPTANITECTLCSNGELACLYQPEASLLDDR